MFLQCSLGKRGRSLGQKVGISQFMTGLAFQGDFVLEVGVKVRAFLLYLHAAVLFKLELYSFQGFPSRLMKPVSGGNSDII